jgi:hypothetical protein
VPSRRATDARHQKPKNEALRESRKRQAATLLDIYAAKLGEPPPGGADTIFSWLASDVRPAMLRSFIEETAKRGLPTPSQRHAYMRERVRERIRALAKAGVTRGLNSIFFALLAASQWLEWLGVPDWLDW